MAAEGAHEALTGGYAVSWVCKSQVYELKSELISSWHPLACDARARLRAVKWLVDQGLLEDGTAQRFATDHPP